ncbi:MAG TPA: hypothetical protein VGK88_04815 [bacterium]|jgi:multisubunit Na+/H+ antiporter MnhC subunit
MTTPGRNLPLTTRILASLPGPRTLWAGLWALLAVMPPVMLTYVVRLSGHPAGLEFMLTGLRQAFVLAYMLVLALWAGEKVQHDVEAATPAIAQLTAGNARDEDVPPIQGLGGVTGPLVLTAITTAVVTVGLSDLHGWTVALIMIPLEVVINLPLMTLFWSGLALLAGLDRLGRRPLHLDRFPDDPSLGTRPIGGLAATALWIFAAMTVPFLLVSIDNRVSVVIGLVIFLVGIGLFFLSMARLHRQMTAAKHRYLASARALYAEAFEPIKSSWTLTALAERAPLLGAAKALEDRALGIQEWPFDERTNARIVILISSVSLAAISRFVLGSLGL